MKKTLTILAIILQLSWVMVPVAFATPGPGGGVPASAPTPAPTPAPGGAANGSSDSAPAPGPNDGSSFSVMQYLTAPGQNQKYFGDSAHENKFPLASAIIQFINLLVLTIGSVCFLAVLIGGFVYMTSHGNETQINKAKEILIYAIIGLIIVLAAYFITAFVQSLFYDLPKK